MHEFGWDIYTFFHHQQKRETSAPIRQYRIIEKRDKPDLRSSFKIEHGRTYPRQNQRRYGEPQKNLSASILSLLHTKIVAERVTIHGWIRDTVEASSYPCFEVLQIAVIDAKIIDLLVWKDHFHHMPACFIAGNRFVVVRLHNNNIFLISSICFRSKKSPNLDTVSCPWLIKTVSINF